jgi:hypothetical protein
VFVGTNNEFDLDGADDVAEVKNSTGRAAALDTNTEVQVSGGIGVDGQNWHWSTFVGMDREVPRDEIIWSVRENYILAFNDSDANSPAEFVLWYYNSTSTNSYRLTVPGSHGSVLKNVQASRNGTQLTLRNSTGTSSSLTITPGTDTSAPAPNGSELVGTLEETQTWDRTLNSSERQTVRTDPLEPVGVGDRDARLMFDQSGRGVAVDLRSASGEIVGSPGFFSSVRTSGIPGDVLTRGVDYKVSGGSIVLLAGGEVEDAPRIVVEASSGETNPILGALLGPITGALSMLVLVALALAGVTALRSFNVINDGF